MTLDIVFTGAEVRLKHSVEKSSRRKPHGFFKRDILVSCSALDLVSTFRVLHDAAAINAFHHQPAVLANSDT